MEKLREAVARILMPLARLAIARGVRFPDLSDWLKQAYLAAAERHFATGGKALNVSRASVLTGLQRKDIKALRARRTAPPPAPTAGPLPRVVALWQSDPAYLTGRGKPRALPRAGAEGPSFETLVASVSRDIHARSVLDELLRLGLVEVDARDRVMLVAEAFVPSADEAALTGYLGANLGDHAAAATENLLAAPASGPHFERAAHYNRLAPDSVAELDRLSRKLLGAALAKVNAQAQTLQRRDAGRAEAEGRFRAGAYVLARPEEDETP